MLDRYTTEAFSNLLIFYHDQNKNLNSIFYKKFLIMFKVMNENILSDKKFKWFALKISLCIVFTYLLSLLFPEFFFNNFSLLSKKIIERPWTLITYAFLHSNKNFTHIFYNSIALAIFGSILEKIIGYKKFLIVFISSLIFSSLVGIYFYENMIGASGGIMGIVGCLTIIKPKMIIFGYGAPMPIILISLFWVAGDLLGIFYADEVAHISHIAGIIFGFIIGYFIRIKFMRNLKENKNRKERLISEDQFKDWEDKWLQRG